MLTEMQAKPQPDILDDIAQIFHVRRSDIASLFARKRLPLPMPPKGHTDDRYVITPMYLKRLKQWLYSEKENGLQQEARLFDFKAAERELTKLEQKVVDYDFERVFPPGYFLG